MKPTFRPVSLITILLSAGLACNAVTNVLFVDTPTPSIQGEPQFENQKTESITDITDCPAVTDGILEAAVHYYDEGLDVIEDEEPEELYLVIYSVTGDRISAPFYEEVPADLAGFQEDIAGHKEIWNYFVKLIPPEERVSLSEYSIVTDGEGNILAAVAQTANDPAQWGLEVDIRDAGDKLNLTYTLIHEYAHLMTLGPAQVMPSQAVFDDPDNEAIYLKEVSACPDYFPGEGCSQPDSYLNMFFNDFWADIYEEWQDVNLIEDDDTYYDALDDFYYKYEDRFVTDYAATNPEEDIAEAFSFFILSPRPKGDTIAEQKVLFFYRDPRLIRLRDQILRGVCQPDQ